jgi:cation diffusion facilitator CzcD-associated flavoprotein CzcO
MSYQPSWSSFFAPGPEIKAYLKRVSEKHSLSRYIKLSHRVNSAHYDTSTGKWNLEILDIRTNTTFTDSADFVLSSTGGLSRWSWPDIEGLHSFKGELMHSARYESEMGLGLEGRVEEGEDLEKRVENEREKWGDKKVAVIGVGSSAIQIVPSLQKVCSKVTNFVRGKTCESLYRVAPENT